MATDLVNKGNSHQGLDEFAEAIQCYTEALKLEPSNVDVYLRRAICYLRVQEIMDAVQDASKVIELDPSNVKAYQVKGQGYFMEQEYEAALESFQMGCQLAPNNTQMAEWVKKCQAQLGDTTDDIKKPASQPAPQPTSSVAQKPQPAAGATEETNKEQEMTEEQKLESKYRHSYYQTNNSVELDVYARDITPERASVDIQQNRLCIVIKDSAGAVEFKFDKELYAQVDPSLSSFELKKPKIAVKLIKVDTSLTWPSLGRSDQVRAANYSTECKPPQYPTSRKTDFDLIEKDLKVQESTDQDGAGIDKFFKDIYAGADEDSRRAMMKSFIESSGTVLSTSWSDIGSKKTETKPPDGMDVRKWEY